MEVLKKLDRRKIKPKFIGTKEQKAKGQGKVVMINVAESSLDILRSKKVLNTVQYYTALRFRRLWEKSRIGSYTANFNSIGGGNAWQSMAEDRIDAIYKLSRSHTWLGNFSFQLMYRVCVEDFNLKEISAIYQFKKGYAGDRLREAAEELKKFFDQAI